MSHISRRDFLRASALVSASLALNASGLSTSFAQAAPQKRWFKGNLHQHCQWSDGKPLPEVAVDWYKSRGYNFICPSDHNVFQSKDLRFDYFGVNSPLTPEQRKAAFADEGETSLWKQVSAQDGWPKLTQKHVDEAANKFGADSIRSKKVGDSTFIRMKTFDELAEQFVEEDKFLMIPGFEQTGGSGDGRQVHMNFVNVRQTFPYINAQTSLEVLTKTFDKGVELYGAGAPYLYTANHPEWRFYDFSPSDMIATPQVRVFELLNNGVDGAYKKPEGSWSPEKFWDVVNAWRATHRQRALLGMGSDDRHGYDGEPTGWSVVRAEKLDTLALLAAIDAGDVYASNGLDFAEIEFDGKTLGVKIDVKENATYRIEFIGTKKDYDPTCKTFDVAKSETSPARTIEKYSDEIGVVLETVEGTEGSYALKNDDLYVRAKIVKIPTKSNAWDDRPAAWTQPYSPLFKK